MDAPSSIWPDVACVDVPALPLQLVWRAQPAWRALPVVVVEEDRPQALVRWACERARAAGVLPGHRYGHALGLCAGLRAQVIAEPELRAAHDELARALHGASPRVEQSPLEAAGTAWLDGRGLARLHPDAAAWAHAVHAAASGCGVQATVVAGFSRFATFALARTQRAGTVRVLASPEDERAQARVVPLARLELAPTLRDALDRLGITTVGQLVRLPGGGILERFGKDAHHLYQLAASEGWDPLQPMRPPEAHDEHEQLEEDERDLERLGFVIKRALDRLLARLAARGQALTALHVELTVRHSLSRHERHAERLAPASPTLDGRALLGLVRLRLEQGLPQLLGPATRGTPSIAGVHAVRVWAEAAAATREQLALFASRPRRDLRAASEAVARLRAELGDDAVVRAVLRDGHLPEARFGWEPISAVSAPTPALADGSAPISTIATPVRRVLARPQRLPEQPTNVRDDGWCLTGLEPGAVVHLDGPYLVSGAWWASDAGVQRAYHFVETQRGDCLWIYYDQVRRRWFHHGAVE
jgi:protein ImuB